MGDADGNWRRKEVLLVLPILHLMWLNRTGVIHVLVVKWPRD